MIHFICISVVNFGWPDLSSKNVDSISPDKLCTWQYFWRIRIRIFSVDQSLVQTSKIIDH